MSASSLKIKYFGHSFVKVSFGKTNVLIDPFINNYSASSSNAPLLKPRITEDKLGKIDIVFVTHEHFDHFDKKAIENIAKNGDTVVVGHHSVLSELNLPPSSLKPVQSWQKFSLKGMEIETVSVHNPKAFYPMGYLISNGKKSIFHPGDTTLMERFVKSPPSIALLPIGGSNTMDIIDAVKATKTMKPEIVIPIHYNTFESIKADPHDFVARIEKSPIQTKAKVLKPGQCFVY
jgi:L-ascorbate metabolism protein UlaG (beta-lactamase superfamily)